MRTALVHDWLTGMRGGERVLEALCGLYPNADIFTLYHRRGSVSASIERHRIRTSFVQRLPLAGSHYRQYLPLFPMAVEQFDLDPVRSGDQFKPLRGQSDRPPGTREASLLLPFTDALCVGSVRYLLRAGAGWTLCKPLDLQACAGAAGAMGCVDRGARSPLRGDLRARCGPDPPIL